MLKNRYTVVVADRASGVLSRYTLNLGTGLGLLIAILATPMLLGLGFRWSASTEIDRLRTNVAVLEVENAAYRGVPERLETDLAALQMVVADLDARAALPPDTLAALNQLPAALKARVIGGGFQRDAPNSLSTVAASSSSVVLSSPRTTFALLNDLLGNLGSHLQDIRYGVERRRALATSTPSIRPIDSDHSWLSSAFGYRKDPFTGLRTFHRAMDFSSPRGQPVYATAPGRVQSAKRTGNLGNLVILNHGYGLLTRYGHLSRFAVDAGQRVERGELIGYVGSTGRSTGSHVHYEIWLDGRPLNPWRYLPPPGTLSTNN